MVIFLTFMQWYMSEGPKENGIYIFKILLFCLCSIDYTLWEYDKKSVIFPSSLFCGILEGN